MRRFNCVTGGVAPGKQIPDECWQIRFPAVGRDFLAAVPRTYINNQRQKGQHRRNVTLAECMAGLVELGELTVAAVGDLVRAFSFIRLRRLRAHLPDDAPYVEVIDAAMGPAQRFVLPAIPPPNAMPLALEFESALRMWEAFSSERAQRKVARGNPYDHRTLGRRISDAARFVGYLQSEGVMRWTDVAQRHLDEYAAVAGGGAAQRVYTFLHFAQTKFSFAGKILRPRDKRRDMLADIASESDVQLALERARNACSAEDSPVVGALVVRLVVLYAQTVTACADLTIANVKVETPAAAIRFNELWIPLDDETASLMRRHLRASIPPGAPGATPVFGGSLSYLQESAANVAGLSMKKLRLAAVYNILDSGYTDRSGIAKALGISLDSIRLVELVCCWDVQDSVSDDTAELRSDLLSGKL